MADPTHEGRYAAYSAAAAEASATMRAAQAAYDSGDPGEWFRLAEEASARQRRALDAYRDSGSDSAPARADIPKPR